METGAERLRGAALVCAAAACWSLGGLFVRLIGEDLDGWTIAFWRSAFMVLAVGGWLLAAHGLKAFTVYRAMGWAGVASGLLLALSFVMFILAITRTSVANAVVLQSAAPLVSAVLGRIFLRETLAAPTLVAIGFAIAGIAGDVCRRARRRRPHRQRAGARRRHRLRRQHRGGAGCARARPGAGHGAGGPVRHGGDAAAGDMAAPSAYDLGLLAAMGALQLGLGLFLFMRGAPHLTAAQVGLLTLLEVILAPIWVWLAFAEVPAPRH